MISLERSWQGRFDFKRDLEVLLQILNDALEFALLLIQHLPLIVQLPLHFVEPQVPLPLAKYVELLLMQ